MQSPTRERPSHPSERQEAKNGEKVNKIKDKDKGKGEEGDQIDTNFWLKLDSNPATYSQLAYQLGLSQDWTFCDIFGLDIESLSFIPSPVVGLILLFPYGEVAHKRASAARKKQNPPQQQDEEENTDLKEAAQHSLSSAFFVRQVVENCCGAIAVVHCLANNPDLLGITQDSLIADLVRNLGNLSPADRGHMFSSHPNLRETNNQMVLEGLHPPNNLQGTVMKKTDVQLIPRWKKRYFELQGHKLYYWRSQELSETSKPKKIINLLSVPRVVRRRKQSGETIIQFRVGVTNYFLRPSRDKHNDDAEDLVITEEFKSWAEALVTVQQYWHLYYTVNPLPPGEDPGLLKKRRKRKKKKKGLIEKIPQLPTLRRPASCNHFICFVPVKNPDSTFSIVELDGISQAPLFHGVTTLQNFLTDCVKIIQTQFLAYSRDDRMNFNLIGLVPT